MFQAVNNRFNVFTPESSIEPHDVVSKLLFQMYTKLKREDAKWEIISFEYYLRASLRNKIVTLYKVNSKNQRLLKEYSYLHSNSKSENLAFVEDEEDISEKLDKINTIINELDLPCQKIMKLRYLQALKYSDIANRLTKESYDNDDEKYYTLDNVRQINSRCLKKFKTLYQRKYHGHK